MPIVTSARLVVTDDPEARLFGLKRAMQNRILRAALRAGARPVQRAAKAYAPKRTGSLKASLSVKIGINRKTKVVYAVIGPRRRFAKKIKGGGTLKGVTPTKYTHLVEFGTKPHSLTRGDKLARRGRTAVQTPGGRRHPGSKPDPFLEDAIKASNHQALDAMRRAIEREIDKELRRTWKRATN